MDTIIEQMIAQYDAKNLYEKKNAMKEVIQEIVLCGLSRAGFFRQAAFYGGTALRIFYGLDRFSEDLDFSLIETDENYDIKSFLPQLEKEICAYGMKMTLAEKEKSTDSKIQSAFLKGNTREHLLLFYRGDQQAGQIAKNEVIKVKFEIDINPPGYATFERKYRMQPIPYEVNLYDMSSLFAGKLHAVIGRSWKNRVKGRDLYDYVFYLSRRAKVNIPHLKARLIQSGHMGNEQEFTIDTIKDLLCQRFETIDYQQAKEDVVPFIHNTEVLEIWSADFFKEITNGLTAE